MIPQLLKFSPLSHPSLHTFTFQSVHISLLTDLMIDWVIEDEWAEWASITRWPKAGSLKVTATFSISSGWNLLVHRNCVYMEPKNTEVSVFEYSGVHAKTSVTLYSVELLSQRMLAGPNLLSNSDQTEDREARSRSHLMLLNSIFFHPPAPHVPPL